MDSIRPPHSGSPSANSRHGRTPNPAYAPSSAPHIAGSSSELSAINWDSPPSLPSLPSSSDPESDFQHSSPLPPPDDPTPRPSSRPAYPSLNPTNNPLNPKGSTSSSTLVNDECSASTRQANKSRPAAGSRTLNQYHPPHVISAFEIPEGAIPNQAVLDFLAEHDKEQHSSFVARMNEKKLFERSGMAPPPVSQSQSPTPSDSEPTPSTSAESRQPDPDPPPDEDPESEHTSPEEPERTGPLLRNTRSQTADQDRLKHLMTVERMPPRPPHPFRRPLLSPKAPSNQDAQPSKPCSEHDTDTGTDTFGSQAAGDSPELAEPVKEPGMIRMNAIFDNVMSRNDANLLVHKPGSKQMPADDPPRPTGHQAKSIAPFAHLRGKVVLTTSTSVRNPTLAASRDDSRSVPSSQTSQAQLILNTELEGIAQTFSRTQKAGSGPAPRRIRPATEANQTISKPPPERPHPPPTNFAAPDPPVSQPSGAEPPSSDALESEEPTLVRRPRAHIATNKPTVGPADHPGGSTNNESGTGHTADTPAPASSPSSKPASTGFKRPGWRARPFLTSKASTSEVENSADEAVGNTAGHGWMVGQETDQPVGHGLGKAVKRVTFSAAHLVEEARAGHKPRDPPTPPIDLPPSALASSTPPQSRTMPGRVSPRHVPFQDPRDHTLYGSSSKFDPDPNNTTASPRIAGYYPATPTPALNFRPGTTRQDSERLLDSLKKRPPIRPTTTSLKALQDELDEERPREPLAGSSSAAARRAGGPSHPQHNHDQESAEAGARREKTDSRPPSSLKGKEKENVPSSRFGTHADRATEAAQRMSRPSEAPIGVRTSAGIASGAGSQDKWDETLVNSDQTRVSSTLTPHPPGWLGFPPSSHPTEPPADHPRDAGPQRKKAKDGRRKSVSSRRPLLVPRSGTQHTPSIPVHPPPTADQRPPSSLAVPGSSSAQQHAPPTSSEVLSHRPSSRSSTRPPSLPSAPAPYDIPTGDIPRTTRPASQRTATSTQAKPGDTQPIVEGPLQTWTPPSFSGFHQSERRLMSTPAGHAPNQRGDQWHGTDRPRVPRAGGLENVLSDLTGAVEGMGEARNPIEALADTSSFMSLTNDSSVETVSPQPNTGSVGMDDLVRSSNKVEEDRARLESRLAKKGGLTGGQKRSRWRTAARTVGAVAVQVLVAWLVLNLVTIRVYNKILETVPPQNPIFDSQTASGGLLVELGRFVVDWLGGFPDARGRAVGSLHGGLPAEIGGGWWRDIKELTWDGSRSDGNLKRFIGDSITDNFAPS